MVLALSRHSVTFLMSGMHSLFLLCLLYHTVSGWHAYDEHKHRVMKAERCTPIWSSPEANSTEIDTCPCYHEATRPYSSDFIERLSLWPDLMGQVDVEHGEALYGSQWALEAIHASQNPLDCRKAKYLISGGWPYGFGSRIHMEGILLGMAMHLGRVYLPHPDGDNIFWETAIPFCRDQHDATLNCFYAHYSKCTIADATADTGGDVNKLRSYFMGDFRTAFQDLPGLTSTIATLEHMKSINVILTYGGGAWDGHAFIPHQMRPILACSPMREDLAFYWWRAVSATYMTRPNQRALRVLNQLHGNPLEYKSCIAMFVRHGDKGIEMKLLDFAAYRRTAEQLWQQGLVPGATKNVRFDGHFDTDTIRLSTTAPPSYNGTLFITTEDPAVIAEAEAFGKADNWRIAYTNLFDRAQQTAFKTWDEQHKKGAPAVHDQLEYLSMLLNLYISTQCEAWVCTLASNSCRLMDELRATIGGKANRYFADLSGETCENPPCVADHGHIKQVGERRRRLRH